MNIEILSLAVAMAVNILEAVTNLLNIAVVPIAMLLSLDKALATLFAGLGFNIYAQTVF